MKGVYFGFVPVCTTQSEKSHAQVGGKLGDISVITFNTIVREY